MAMEIHRIPQGATEKMTALLCAVSGGRPQDVPELVTALSVAERRACFTELKAMRRRMREEPWLPGYRERHEALWLAGAGCCTGAAAAAQWLAARDLPVRSLEPALILALFADRSPEWIGDVAHRLAARPTVVQAQYDLVEALVRRSGCAVPTDDAFVREWVSVTYVEAADNGRRLVDDLRDDAFLPVLAPRLFEVPDIGTVLDWSWMGEAPVSETWPGALAQLAREKVLDRGMLLDGCLSRLLRGDRPSNVRGFLKLLNALEPTVEENADRVITWIRLLPDAHSTVVTRAQQVLTALDEAGRLETEHLAEASRAVLFRAEKKLVRAQLTLIDKAIKKDRSRAGELLPAAAEAFGHQDHTLQERALNLVARHLRHAGEAVLPELAAAAEQLSPALRKRAAEVLGTEPVHDGADSSPEAEILPPPPAPERLDGRVPPVAEVAEEVGAQIDAMLNGKAVSPVAFERMLGGLVVHAYRDREGLVSALEPVVHRHSLLFPADRHEAPVLHGPTPLVGALLGVHSTGSLRSERERIVRTACAHSALARAIDVRILEAAQRIVEAPVPFLLATPVWSTGAIDPAVLVDRLRAYEEAGIEPAEADFDQALLRVKDGIGGEVLKAARSLASPAGRGLAAWLEQGGLPHPVSSRCVEAPVSSRRVEARPPLPWQAWNQGPGPARLQVRTEAFSGHTEFTAPFHKLLDTFDPDIVCSNPYPFTAPGPHMVTVLPWHPEIVAARTLAFTAGTADSDERGISGLLTALAEAGGVAGPAVHLAVAYSLGARHAQDRISAVDALVVLAARKSLDHTLLGQELGELVASGAVKPQRLAESLGEAARTGAHATTWAVLAAALPRLLTTTGIRGRAALVQLAADCAERCGARGEIPEVAEAAELSGSSQLVKQARRLRDQLARS